MRLRHLLPALAGLIVTAVVLWWPAASTGWDDLPLGWWVVFGGFAVLLGCGAAWVVHALLRR